MTTVISPVACISKVSSPDDDELVMHKATPQGERLSNTEVLSNLPHYLSHLPNDHDDMKKLINFSFIHRLSKSI